MYHLPFEPATAIAAANLLLERNARMPSHPGSPRPLMAMPQRAGDIGREKRVSLPR
jgi:hypothetical protein